MNDPLQEQNRPYTEPADPYSDKANFEIKQQELHEKGYPLLWREVSNLLILLAVIGVIVLLSRIL
ncbi:hypothetical protein PUW24_17090 [Paenibacillus urinalis]|uniref:Uncharacterized protein n=1 Tax=Paenibacillus urinalis TaxID=521520 RepID=A0AAX3N421_9BACL|nr:MULTISPECIES: hypothetical protein [Paenibacillus]WDH84433.1 hypothetical protein PUW23_09575 [Paenibacillus urinalis]WDH95902.1 hypothetical protein PUW24_17090 [Paenibacillus urinalis]WDI04117.1 hypothetical protein PUW25_09270 [Paenibacillus urinalis]GAK38567.1 hypothetical protein TCA2_0293 [Paenibacillus sp. TCA20]